MSGLRVSAVGLGCMGMSHAYGKPANKAEMIELLAEAVDMGYTLFDTAELYGSPEQPNLNEEIVGEALAPYRNHVVIATKCGIRFAHPELAANHDIVVDGRPETIRQSVEGSLRRLRTDHIDLYYQHRINPQVGPEIVADTMANLIREGKVLHWGISEADESYLRRAHKVCPVTAIQNRYSMMARWNESLFKVCDELGVGFVAFSPLANGLLSRCYTDQSAFDAEYDYRAGMPQYQTESFEQNKGLFLLLDQLAEAKHATPAQVSLAWMLCKKPWIVPIPGTRRLCRLKENIGAADITLSTDEVAHIDQALNTLPMSAVFGGSKIIDNTK